MTNVTQYKKLYKRLKKNLNSINIAVSTYKGDDIHRVKLENRRNQLVKRIETLEKGYLPLDR